MLSGTTLFLQRAGAAEKAIARFELYTTAVYEKNTIYIANVVSAVGRYCVEIIPRRTVHFSIFNRT